MTNKKVLIEFLTELDKEPENKHLNLTNAIALINNLPDENTDTMTVPQLLDCVNTIFQKNKGLWTDQNRKIIDALENKIYSLAKENAENLSPNSQKR